MTLAEIMAQVVLPALAATSAGVAGGVVYGRRARAPKQSDPPPARSLPPKRSEQLADWATQSWTAERAAREIAEASAHASEIESRRDARERITALERANSNHRVELGRINEQLGALKDGQRVEHTVLSEVRDAVIELKAQCPIMCRAAPDASVSHVVRGGAAGR
jgi:hypothetical protein